MNTASISQATANPAGLDAAFAELRQSLRSYLRRRLPNPELADDLLQDVFVKALSAQRAGRRIDNLTGWLYAAARTTLVDHFRTKGMPMEELDEDLPHEDDDELALHQELSACLRPFIERLPPLYRDTLVATELEGQSMRALADSQQVSLSAVKSRAARGRAMLKEAVLACCNVQMKDGLVDDYHRLPSAGCGSQCG